MANETANKPQVKTAGERWAIAFATTSFVLLVMIVLVIIFFASGGLRYVNHRLACVEDTQIDSLEAGTFFMYNASDKDYATDDIIVFVKDNELYVGQVETVDEHAKMLRLVSDGLVIVGFEDVDGVFEKRLDTLTSFVKFCSSIGGKIAIAIACVPVIIFSLALVVESNNPHVKKRLQKTELKKEEKKVKRGN